jgi:hypothetical protein
MEGKISRVALGSRRSCTTQITTRQRKRVLRWWYRGVSTGQMAKHRIASGSPQLPIKRSNRTSGVQYLAMSKKFRIGDKVKVVGMSPVTFAPGVKDQLGTEKLFKSMLGKVYTVRGFDRYGNVELQLLY